jgi:hypothetical protein
LVSGKELEPLQKVRQSDESVVSALENETTYSTLTMPNSKRTSNIKALYSQEMRHRRNFRPINTAP